MNITINPIGFVSNSRKEIEDDYWGNIISIIEINFEKYHPDCLLELETFSHLEVIFYMHQLDPNQVVIGSRHPRNNTAYPKVGVFAQRVKNRPNLLGLSRCKILNIDKNKIEVKGLDVLDGTPIIDIKPYMQQFGPIGAIIQPKWSDELMEDYYKE